MQIGSLIFILAALVYGWRQQVKLQQIELQEAKLQQMKLQEEELQVMKLRLQKKKERVNPTFFKGRRAEITLTALTKYLAVSVLLPAYVFAGLSVARVQPEKWGFLAMVVISMYVVMPIILIGYYAAKGLWVAQKPLRAIPCYVMAGKGLELAQDILAAVRQNGILFVILLPIYAGFADIGQDVCLACVTLIFAVESPLCNVYTVGLLVGFKTLNPGPGESKPSLALWGKKIVEKLLANNLILAILAGMAVGPFPLPIRASAFVLFLAEDLRKWAQATGESRRKRAHIILGKGFFCLALGSCPFLCTGLAGVIKSSGVSTLLNCLLANLVGQTLPKALKGIVAGGNTTRIQKGQGLMARCLGWRPTAFIGVATLALVVRGWLAMTIGVGYLKTGAISLEEWKVFSFFFLMESSLFVGPLIEEVLEGDGKKGDPTRYNEHMLVTFCLGCLSIPGITYLCLL